MPELSEANRAKTLPILERVRTEILSIAGEDKALIFQMKRYIAKRLEFDERGTPTQRRKTKCGRSSEAYALYARVSFRSVGPNWTGLRPLTGTRKKILNWFVIHVTEQPKKPEALLERYARLC
jgi:hypothetical protein